MFIARRTKPLRRRSEERNSTRVLKLELHSAPPNAVDHGISTQAINISPLRGVKTVNAFFHSFYRTVVLTSWDHVMSDCECASEDRRDALKLGSYR